VPKSHSAAGAAAAVQDDGDHVGIGCESDRGSRRVAGSERREVRPSSWRRCASKTDIRIVSICTAATPCFASYQPTPPTPCLSLRRPRRPIDRRGHPPSLGAPPYSAVLLGWRRSSRQWRSAVQVRWNVPSTLAHELSADRRAQRAPSRMAMPAPLLLRRTMAIGWGSAAKVIEGQSEVWMRADADCGAATSSASRSTHQRAAWYGWRHPHQPSSRTAQ
jgi:hypothetical protein